MPQMLYSPQTLYMLYMLYMTWLQPKASTLPDPKSAIVKSQIL